MQVSLYTLKKNPLIVTLQIKYGLRYIFFFVLDNCLLSTQKQNKKIPSLGIRILQQKDVCFGQIISVHKTSSQKITIALLMTCKIRKITGS